MKRQQRHTPAARAMYRREVRIYTEIFNNAADAIINAACANYRSTQEAFDAFAKAARDAAKQIIGDIISEYVRERVIRPIVADLTR